MKLLAAVVEGYRSIREQLTLHVDSQVSVVLGANDHGKSNLLSALLHLNPEAAFVEDDLNWDVTEKRESLPRVQFDLRLTDSESAEVCKRLSLRANSRNAMIDIEESLAKIEDLDRRMQEVVAEVGAKQAQLAAFKEKLDPDAEHAAFPVEMERLRDDISSGQIQNSSLSDAKSALVEALRIAQFRSLRARAAEENVPFGLNELVEQAMEAEAQAGSVLAASEVAAKEASAFTVAAVAEHGEGSEQHKKAAAAQAAAEKASLGARRAAAQAASIREERQQMYDVVTAHAGAAALDEPAQLDPKSLSGVLVLERRGLGSPLEVVRLGELDSADQDDVLAAVIGLLPRVELIRPQDHLADEVSIETIEDEEHEFMRGIFRYAGLAPSEWSSIFEQNDRSTKRLDVANRVLNETLQSAWSQGSELEFRLDHRHDFIDLQIGDPAVEDRYVRASRRSSGFTHFFALKTVLYARECASSASSFIWLFDEPGIYLHPEGQFDLVKVLEALGRSNQILYSTHSIFMVNKNYPARHRLIRKSSQGTQVDHKPFTGRWQSALDALGLSLPGSLLFASNVLLVEGDSDPVYLLADMQRLAELGLIDADLNDLAMIATNDARNTDALLRLLLGSTRAPTVGVLVDGDSGGKARAKLVEKFAQRHGVPLRSLAAGTTVEDHLLYPDLYKQACIGYVGLLAKDLDLDADSICAELETSYVAKVGKGPSGSAAWYRDEGQRLLELTTAPSSVGAARIYSELVRSSENDSPPGKKRSLSLFGLVMEMLSLGSRLPSADITGS